MNMPKPIKIEIVWNHRGYSELTFLEHVELPPSVTQHEFLEFCIETVERFKKLGTEQPHE